MNDARSSGLQFETVAVAASRLTSQTEEGLLAQRLEREGIDVIEASDAVFDVLSPVKSPSGIVAIAGRKGVTAAEICAQPDAFVLAAIDVQEPGNVGALTARGGGGRRDRRAGLRRLGKSVLVEGAARQHGQRAASADRR